MSFTVSADEKADLACTYAALILNEAQATVNAENIAALLEAAGVEVEGYYPKLFGMSFLYSISLSI